ncbi:MAG: MMPL family transporter, partial [Planctomycetes bacterium]|nr:MMPL family transporter [Planctomycetota bacterium]
MFKFLGRLTTAHPWLVCLAWLAAGASLSWVAPSWDSQTQDDDIHFLPARCPSVRGFNLLQEAFPQDVFASKVIFALEREKTQLLPEDFVLVNQLVADLGQLRQQSPELQIGGITSYQDGLIGKRLISADHHCTLIQVALGTPYLALQTRAAVDAAEARLRKRMNEAGPDVPRLMTTGPAGIGRDLTQASADGLQGTTLATILLVIAVLLLVYRAPLLALIPLATIAVSVWVSLQLLALLTLIPGVHLVNISKVFAIVILYGAGTDYCLFLISRFQENLGKGHQPSPAIIRSVRAVGSALTASAGTVICGLGMMGMAEFAKVRCAGPAIGLSLAVGLLASLTLAPALLHLMGRWVFWPSRGPQPGAVVHSRGLRGPGKQRDALWERLSQGVVARPILVWVTATLALAPLALIGLRVVPDYRPTGELSPRCDSVQGLAAIQRHFTAGEIGPVTVLLVAPTDWSQPAGREVVAHLSRGFGRLPNVAEVRSLTQPLGTPMQSQVLEGRGKGLLGGLLNLKVVRQDIDRALEQADALARQFYVTRLAGQGAAAPRFVTRLDVIFQSDPFDPASMETLQLIQRWLRDQLPTSVGNLGGVEAECYGVTVNARDLAQVTEADRGRVNFLVLAGIFLILVLLVKRPWLAAYLLLTVLFSYLATLGATALAAHWFFDRPFGKVDWRVPFFLFTILVAIGEDYNILLITRMLQERLRFGPLEGTRRALART